jgi:uncharacterized protein YcbX
VNQPHLQLAGRVRALYRYPVKSMRAEPLHEAEVTWYGFDGDRRYAFVKSGNRTGFPWLTGREIPEMVLYSPRYSDPDHPRSSELTVTTPDGRDHPIDSPELLEALASRSRQPAHLMHLSRGCYDAMPISLISTDSVQALGCEAGLMLDPRRFRPNILVDLAEAGPFGEESWIGRLVQVGESDTALLIRCNRRDMRCAMTNIEPDSAERDPRVLKTIVRMRDECAGIYGSVQRVGRICDGDPIFLVTE